MNIQHVLLLCVSSAFIDGRNGRVGAQSDVHREPEGHCCVSQTECKVYSATEGGSITVTCSLFLNRRNWREKCDKVLADTDDVINMSEKYKIINVNCSAFNVSITQLTESDSGRYSCGVRKDYVQCQEFEIRVTRGAVTRGHPCVYLTVFFLLSAICLLILHKYKTRIIQYVNTRLDSRNSEVSDDYDDCVAASTGEGSAYQNLDPHSRDASLYSTLQSNNIYFNMSR